MTFLRLFSQNFSRQVLKFFKKKIVFNHFFNVSHYVQRYNNTNLIQRHQTVSQINKKSCSSSSARESVTHCHPISFHHHSRRRFLDPSLEWVLRILEENLVASVMGRNGIISNN